MTGSRTQPERKIEYRHVSSSDVKSLVETHHYLHKLPQAIQFVFGAYSGKTLAAACIFNYSVGRWSIRLLELGRLVQHPDFTFPLSSFVSWCVRWLKKNQKTFNLLVSYADATKGHHGGIYQACSWTYCGLRATGTKTYITEMGDRVHQRHLADRFDGVTPGPKDVAKVERGWRLARNLGKFLYVKTLNREGEAERIFLGLEALPYPKPREMNLPTDVFEKREKLNKARKRNVGPEKK